jgi:hypothetical protein
LIKSVHQKQETRINVTRRRFWFSWIFGGLLGFSSQLIPLWLLFKVSFLISLGVCSMSFFIGMMVLYQLDFFNYEKYAMKAKGRDHE